MSSGFPTGDAVDAGVPSPATALIRPLSFVVLAAALCHAAEIALLLAWRDGLWPCALRVQGRD